MPSVLAIACLASAAGAVRLRGMIFIIPQSLRHGRAGQQQHSTDHETPHVHEAQSYPGQHDRDVLSAG